MSPWIAPASVSSLRSRLPPLSPLLSVPHAAAAFGLAFLIAFYVLFTSKRVGTLPEDVETALISDADTDYGFFSPHSWWPFAIGASTFVFVLGFVFARWMMVAGLFALMMAIYGLVFEYYRGQFVK